MRRIDELHLEYPFMGSRMLRDTLHREGIAVGRRHVTTLMKRMDLETIYRRPSTSKPAPGHKIYLYLLRGLTVDHPNQVWAMSIIPMARICLSCRRGRLVQPPGSGLAALDYDGGGVLLRSGRRSAGAFWQAGHLHRSGKPVYQRALTGVLLNNAIAISMDGKGSWRDNVFVERIWKSVKYEEVHLKAYASVARTSIGRYLDSYNRRRPHSSLDRRTPDEAYFNHLPQRAAA